MWTTSYYYGLARNVPRSQQVPASVEFINSLQDFTIPSDQDESECSICLKSSEKGDIVNKLPCGHQFHKDCILEWLKKIASCPLCRKELPRNQAAISIPLVTSDPTPERPPGNENPGGSSRLVPSDESRIEQQRFLGWNWSSGTATYVYTDPSPGDSGSNPRTVGSNSSDTTSGGSGVYFFRSPGNDHL